MFDDERLAVNSLGYSFKYHLNIEIPTVVIVHSTSFEILYIYRCKLYIGIFLWNLGIPQKQCYGKARVVYCHC